MGELNCGDNSVRRFSFMIDGMGDPQMGKRLTRDLKEELGIVARCDPAGMWLEVEREGVIDEEFADRVIEVARLQGVELRDRVGSSFVSTISREALRRRMETEWKGRLATALVFLLPAFLIYYLKGFSASATNYLPNGLVAVLVGWVVIASGWPILYQGLISVVARRMTPDLFQSVLILVSYGAGVFELVSDQSVTLFNVTGFAVLSMCLQRFVVWKNAGKTAGHGDLMLPFSGVLLLCMVGGLVVCFFDLRGGLSMMLAVPAMMGVLAVNRLAHPTVWVIPIVLYVAFTGAAGILFSEGLKTVGRIESAFLFGVAVTILCGMFAGVGRGEVGEFCEGERA